MSETNELRIEALKNVNMAWYRLIERVNQAADDGYDVLNPDVLAEAMWDVAQNQIAARSSTFLQQCDLFIRDYNTHFDAIDRKFPRRAGAGR